MLQGTIVESTGPEWHLRGPKGGTVCDPDAKVFVVMDPAPYLTCFGCLRKDPKLAATVLSPEEIARLKQLHREDRLAKQRSGAWQAATRPVIGLRWRENGRPRATFRSSIFRWTGATWAFERCDHNHLDANEVRACGAKRAAEKNEALKGLYLPTFFETKRQSHLTD